MTRDVCRTSGLRTFLVDREKFVIASVTFFLRSRNLQTNASIHQSEHGTIFPGELLKNAFTLTFILSCMHSRFLLTAS